MNDVMMRKLEEEFLDILYPHRGVMAISEIPDLFYGIEETRIRKIIDNLVEQERCAVERLERYGKEDDYVFITSIGLVGIKGAEYAGQWRAKDLTYEKKCHGYSSITEYLQMKKEELQFREAISGFMSRVGGYIKYLNSKDCEEYLEYAVEELTDERYEREGVSSDIRYALIKMAVDRLVEKQGKDDFGKEVKLVNDMIEDFLRKEREKTPEFELIESSKASPDYEGVKKLLEKGMRRIERKEEKLKTKTE